MSYSYHVNLPILGLLKIKDERSLRKEERAREVPVLKIGKIYLVWNKRRFVGKD